jgi:hypothetical protein
MNLPSFLASPSYAEEKKDECKEATQRAGGLPGGSTELPGFDFSVIGGDVSGSIAILGSTTGGVTVERGSGIV